MDIVPRITGQKDFEIAGGVGTCLCTFSMTRDKLLRVFFLGIFKQHYHLIQKLSNISALKFLVAAVQ